MRGGAVAAALVGAALVLSGCQYLLGPIVGGPIYPIDPGFGSFDPGEFGSFDPDYPGFSLPPPEATFTKGSAVVTIDGTAMHLDRLATNGMMYKEMGTDIAWTDGSGNYVHFFGTGEPGYPGFISIDRIAEGKHLGTQDPSACAIKLDKLDATGVAGSATCKNLRWMDMVSSFGAFASPAPGAAFDAEITFEATP
jgi:hypothetical protein